MSGRHRGAANCNGYSAPSGQGSISSSSSQGQQQQRTHRYTSHTRGTAALSAPYPRQGGVTEGGGRGQAPRIRGEPRVLAPPHTGGGNRRPLNTATASRGLACLIEEAPRTKTASYVTPHDAVQSQPAQHGATVVRSGSSPTEGGSILFFSSVQKKGGAFTASERETYAQLHRSRAIPNVNRGRNAGNVMGSGVSAKSVAQQYADLEKDREARALAQAKTAVFGSKRSRFSLNDSPSEEEEDDGDSGRDTAARRNRLSRSSQ
ncbi:hypothetical protein LSCM1_05652 [Leishmania martiniquensis]|uniref:Uncharacterized protein n=1 Tax=Leishmania martiniquensis TaxID=1580590 RepID=A0A836KT96_9TRYP|nr:hypothetical protein LSCM1_05652 [Leishmania martiniquensis]